MMATTLRDIAHACGMDSSTVSRALRGDQRVREETRLRIEKVARESGYIPNLSARSLAGARTRTIWYLIPSIVDPVQVHAVQEASRYLAEKEYELSIILYHGVADRYLHLLRRLSQGVTDGAIIVPGPTGQGKEELASLAARNFPLVFFDRHPSETEIPTVTSDNAGAAAELVKRLAEQGAERFVLLMNRKANAVEQARLQGAMEQLGRTGLPFVLGDRFDSSFLQDNSPLGLIATGQQTIRAFIEAAIPEPPPLLVAVFDDWQGDPFPAGMVTVCKQNLTAMARTACDLILELLEGRTADDIMHRIPPLGFETIASKVN